MVKPYTLEQAQTLVRDALERSKDRHDLWRVLEVLYRTGSVKYAQAAGKALNAKAEKAGVLELLGSVGSQERVNMLLPHTNVILASVVAHDPRHLAVPYGGGPEAEEGAKIAEAVIRYFWLRTRATQDVKDSTWDMVVLGNGFAKVGWSYIEEQVEAGEAEITEQLAELMEGDRALAELEGGELTPEEELVDLVQLTQALAEVDEPFVEYVSPFDIFVPPDARRMWETRWVAQRVTLPIDELRDNEAFRDIDIVPDTPYDQGRTEIAQEWTRDQEDQFGLSGNPDVFETATVFEFYDMRSRRLMVFQVEGAEPLVGQKDGGRWVGDELPYAHRYPPFVHFRNYNPNGREFWAFGDLENVAHVQNLLNEFLTEQVDNARRAGNKYLVEESSMTPELKAALESDVPDVVAVVKNPQQLPLDQIIHSVERHALSGDVYGAKAELEEHMRQVMGINDFQAGGVGADRMSATAAAVVDGLASLRAQEKVSQVEEGAAQIANLILLLCQEMLDTPRAIRIAGPGGAAWEEVDRDLIRGEFQVSIEGGSMKHVNPATREQRGSRLLNEVAPALAQLGFDPVPSVRAALRDMGYDPDVLMANQLPAEGGEEVPVEGGGEPLPEDAPSSVVVDAGGPPTAVQAQVAGDIAL